MIGIVLAAHGPAPGALLESVGMILGEQSQVATVSLMPADSLDGLIERLQQAIKEVNTGDGVLVLLDLFGGTPANAATLLTQQMQQVYAVTGVNIPMLLETFMQRLDMISLNDLAQSAASAGQAGIVDVVQAFHKFRQSNASE